MRAFSAHARIALGLSVLISAIEIIRIQAQKACHLDDFAIGFDDRLHG